MRSTPIAFFALLALLLPASAAQARTPVAVGLGDQNIEMFDQKPWERLKLKKTRYFVRWDVVRHPQELAKVEAFVRKARSKGVRVLVHLSDPDFRRRKGSLPSTKRYRRDVGRLVRKLRPLGVREWGVWNEANHDSQPTWRNPRRAAAYFRIMRRICRGCTIVALDVLDQKGVERYISRFYRALPRSQRRYARIVGIHNYSDTNRKRSRGTRGIIRAVKRRNRRATFWLTETGGVVRFSRAFPCSERRAASRVKYMFSLARRYRRDIDRLYAYNYFGTNCESRFDAGLVRRDGTPRPSYDAFRRGLRSFKR